MQAAAAQTRFTLVRPTIRNGAVMPLINAGQRDDCHGGNKSPPLTWSHPPEGTASFAVSMADLDAKVGIVWLWLMFNIPPSAVTLPENAAEGPGLAPQGIGQARNGFDETGYSGPCPRKGAAAHHYLITVWALNASHLTFKDGTPAQPVAVFLRRHALGHASLTARYGDH
ncbi:MAG TPA: YbhB/YbcL family Raf kinase inhibitor-like protein [Acidisoma sp.]|nr:YbhB/YbcL family Raf kinase inhibitor-like protein [Acidisoma sp.]